MVKVRSEGEVVAPFPSPGGPGWYSSKLVGRESRNWWGAEANKLVSHKAFWFGGKVHLPGQRRGSERYPSNIQGYRQYTWCAPDKGPFRASKLVGRGGQVGGTLRPRPQDDVAPQPPPRDWGWFEGDGRDVRVGDKGSSTNDHENSYQEHFGIRHLPPQVMKCTHTYTVASSPQARKDKTRTSTAGGIRGCRHGYHEPP